MRIDWQAREVFQWGLVVLLAVFTADLGIAQAELKLRPEITPLPELSSGAPASVPASDKFEALLSTTLSSEVGKAGAYEVPEKQASPEQPFPKVTLAGTLAAGEGDGLAIFELDGKIICLSRGDSFPQLAAKLSDVQARSVKISSGESELRLFLGENSDSEKRLPAPQVVREQASPPSSVEAIRTSDEIKELFDRPDLIFQAGFAAKPVIREEKMVGALLALPNESHPLARLGLRSGDIVLSLNQKRIDEPGALSKLLPVLRNSETLVIELEREGKAQSITIELEDY